MSYEASRATRSDSIGATETTVHEFIGADAPLRRVATQRAAIPRQLCVAVSFHENSSGEQSKTEPAGSPRADTLAVWTFVINPRRASLLRRLPFLPNPPQFADDSASGNIQLQCDLFVGVPFELPSRDGPKRLVAERCDECFNRLGHLQCELRARVVADE